MPFTFALTRVQLAKAQARKKNAAAALWKNCMHEGMYATGVFLHV